MHMLRSTQDRARLCCEPEEISSSSVLRACCESHVLLACRRVGCVSVCLARIWPVTSIPDLLERVS